ncbi:MAG: flagellar type III secretion system pore protein FliP [Deltaproteobacteria bacterium]|nr:flagellar type III secretion system pore protein FliP [Deltaproteobacteria bacterium]
MPGSPAVPTRGPLFLGWPARVLSRLTGYPVAAVRTRNPGGVLACRHRAWFAIALLVIGAVLSLFPAASAAQPIPLPSISIGVADGNRPGEVATSVKVLILFTILSLAPSILIMTTSFTRLIVVFSFLRQAIGTQQTPPNQVLVGLALFLTFFIMSPVITKVNSEAFQPFLSGKITQEEAWEKGTGPLKTFMAANTRDKDLALMVNLSKTPRPNNVKDLGMSVITPAFVLSELRTAFQVGFLIYIPFLVIDMVVASSLMSMGMMMLPPIMISLPFKLMLFVLLDGWNLIVGSLMKSFTV